MKYSVYILILVVFLNCSQKKNKCTKQEDIHINKTDATELVVSELQNFEASDNRVDLDSLLKDEFNEYLAELVNGELDLCRYELLHPFVTDLSVFQKQTEEYIAENKTEEVDVYVFENSFIKEYYNSRPQVKNRDLVCGRILSEKIKLNHGIKIGMTKDELLSKIFKPSTIFDSIDSFTIYKDEMGEFWTQLIFKHDTLVEVYYDSVYDWIEKELK